MFGLTLSIIHATSNQETLEAGLNEKLTYLQESLFTDGKDVKNNASAESQKDQQQEQQEQQEQKEQQEQQQDTEITDVNETQETTDQTAEDDKVDKFIKQTVDDVDNFRISADSLDDLSKMTDEEIREQLKLINAKQQEKEVLRNAPAEIPVDPLRANEDRVEGSNIDNPERIRKDQTPDGLPWAKFEINRVVPSKLNTNIQKEKATLFTLCRNSEMYEILDSIQQLETRFNSKFHYDWVFLNDEPFSEEFMELTSNMVSGRARYGLIPHEHWSYPSYVDEAKAKEIRESRKWASIVYGNSESYRHMCRFNSMFFYKHPIMEEYQYYWRVEPHVSYHCDVLTDPFKYMKENKKKYGFNISMRELPNTIETLWETSKLYFKKLSHDYFDPTNDNLLKFISDDNGETYNLCHYWTNFEIADLSIYRNEIYEGYVNHLDQAGGFFYERWGDAPVHSIIFSLMLKNDEVHLFDSISYEHTVASSCPLDSAFYRKAKCTCNPDDIWVIKSDSSCNLKFWEVGTSEQPAELADYLKRFHDKKIEQEELRAAQRKLRMETARRQSEIRRKKAEERRKNRLETKKKLNEEKQKQKEMEEAKNA